MSLFGSSQPDIGHAEPTISSIIPQYPVPSKKSPATVIAKGVRLEGEFKSQGDVLIEGEVHGTIETEGLLTLGSEAFLKASVTATDAVIAGKLEGNITIKRKVDVKSTARITGDLVCETIAVESGAALQGNVRAGSAPAINPVVKLMDGGKDAKVV